MRGRRKKSIELTRLQGDTGHRKKCLPAAMPSEPAAEKMVQEIISLSPRVPPAWLPEGARLIWSEQLPIVLRETKLQESGLQLFAAYCESLHRLEKYSQEIERNGATYTTASGYVRKRPQVEMRDKAANAVRNFASELNLTPKSWIGSMGTFADGQLDIFLNRGRIASGGGAPNSVAVNAVHSKASDV